MHAIRPKLPLPCSGRTTHQSIIIPQTGSGICTGDAQRRRGRHKDAYVTGTIITDAKHTSSKQTQPLLKSEGKHTNGKLVSRATGDDPTQPIYQATML